MQDKRESAVPSCLCALTESIKQVPLVVQLQSVYCRDVRRSLAELEIVYGGYRNALGENVLITLLLLRVSYVSWGYLNLVRS